MAHTLRPGAAAAIVVVVGALALAGCHERGSETAGVSASGGDATVAKIEVQQRGDGEVVDVHVEGQRVVGATSQPHLDGTLVTMMTMSVDAFERMQKEMRDSGAMAAQVASRTQGIVSTSEVSADAAASAARGEVVGTAVAVGAYVGDGTPDGDEPSDDDAPSGWIDDGMSSEEAAEMMPGTVLVRLARDGAVDEAFGDGGMLQLGQEFVANEVPFVHDDGSFTVVSHDMGEMDAGPAMPTPVLEVRRFGADGTADSSFANRGLARFASGIFATTAAALDDGSIVVGGHDASPMMGMPGSEEMGPVARIDASGAANAAFGRKGVAKVRGSVMKLLPLGDGRLLVLTTRQNMMGMGESADNADTWMHMLRRDGSPDTSWGDGGSRRITVPERGHSAMAAEVLRDANGDGFTLLIDSMDVKDMMSGPPAPHGHGPDGQREPGLTPLEPGEEPPAPSFKDMEQAMQEWHPDTACWVVRLDSDARIVGKLRRIEHHGTGAGDSRDGADAKGRPGAQGPDRGAGDDKQGDRGGQHHDHAEEGGVPFSVAAGGMVGGIVALPDGRVLSVGDSSDPWGMSGTGVQLLTIRHDGSTDADDGGVKIDDAPSMPQLRVQGEALVLTGVSDKDGRVVRLLTVPLEAAAGREGRR